MATYNTNCVIENRESFPNGAVRLSMRMLNSNRPMTDTNELPNILHSIVKNNDVLGRLCFDYGEYGFEMITK